MTFSRQSPFRRHYRLLILVIVGLLGLVSTAWVTREMINRSNDRVEQRFLRDAQERADLIVDAFSEPLKQFTVLQRLFHSVGKVDWPVFKKFVEPMLGQPGVRSFGWMPAVNAADRAQFEQSGRRLWGNDFAISERDADGNLFPLKARERYYPVFFVLPVDVNRQALGLNLHAAANRGPVIEQSIDTGGQAASGVSQLIVDKQKQVTVAIMAPVYRDGTVPATRDERRAAVRGVLFCVLDVGDLFDAVNSAVARNGLHVSLLDQTLPADRRLIHRWVPKAGEEASPRSGIALSYSQEFELARNLWTVRIEAGPAWLEANAPGNVVYVPLVGVLLTLLLLVYLHRLLDRSALADSLEHSHEDDLKQRRAAEAWANKLSLAVEQNPASIYITDLTGRIEYVNEKFIETSGYSRAEAIGQDARIMQPGFADQPIYQSLWASIEAGQNWQGELQSERRDGTQCWDRLLVSPIKNHEGKVTNYVMIKENITELRQVMLRLQESEGRFRGAMSVMVEGLAIISPEGSFLFANRVAEELLGFAEVGLQGHRLEDIGLERLHEDGTPYLYSEYPTTITLRDGCEVRDAVVGLRSTDGNLRWLQVNTAPLRIGDEVRCGAVLTFSDMTERQATQQRIEFLAHHDPLTGLPNRLLLRDRMAQAQALAARTQSRVALMFLDLDRFKTINDSLGHPVGDAMLKEVVERLKSCVRESDTISRQGGDEFIILLNDVRDSEAVARVADKIHQRMGEPIMLGNHSLITSFSIGIALYPDDGDEFDALLQKADTAMYHAKEAGRTGHRFFTEQMNLQVVEHLTLETQLRQALENKEFILHYQPQLDLHEGGIIGVEALIRWNSPDNGLISPARFIPVAEDSGIIVPIGAWVLVEACRQARAWQDAGLPPFVVAVNLSAVQFKRQDLVNTVINALVLSDLDAQWLELELTESILIQDAEVTLDSVRRLKALGVRLSVDDFGTGYSSLAYLKRFAVDKLKIDQSFVRDLVTDPDDAAIVRAIIQMASSLKLKTIAEGVETEELANLLRIFHCDEIQGYWFARPMLADQLEAFVRAHQAKQN
ncbi:EAL domain-containing protein [Propionivibrio sp.]|uniref:bifunctional diguanylate cyclase/phosphodiesterase n=1 Tax=Propionivibrio sp. TaxID=2212460 RepID=UPI00260CA858|nr:EAL domain-containing protein [Propionivibrio sp.]